ncbi:MAG: FAD-dependent oxidoreductase [Candidatus Omnitrophica bacterium]|nr:FAD-dependent oxidoreductase [Candidatus Omnitrophota bacterium]MCM8828285.1 FAD-dependent oxidoreductase [Candidatus Omnitrophota bacterium]
MDLVIIGSGPAGISAAIYAARANISFVVLERMYPGGKLVWIEKIENYPGFPGGISGPELAERFYNHATKLNVNFTFQNVRKIKKQEGIFKVYAGENIYDVRFVIVASGSVPSKLGIKGEDEFSGRGVSYCAICDGAFFKNRKVVVIGEGKHVEADINYLKSFSSVVWLRKPGVVEKDIFGVSIIKGIPVEINGENSVRSIVVKTESGIKEIETDGVFIFAGFKPSFDFLPSDVALDSSGYVKTDAHLKSSVDGIYACGDIRSGSLKQIVSAVNDGAIAVNEIRKRI